MRYFCVLTKTYSDAHTHTHPSHTDMKSIERRMGQNDKRLSSKRAVNPFVCHIQMLRPCLLYVFIIVHQHHRQKQSMKLIDTYYEMNTNDICDDNRVQHSAQHD